MTATPNTVSMGMSFTHPTALNLGVQTADGYHQELLRGLTHKLNNMLAIIQGFSSLILMSDEQDAATRENMQHIKEASMSISTLSERIRQAGGCAKLSLQPLNLNEYLSVVDGALRAPFASTGVPFEMEVASSLPPVEVDPSKLKDILVEILRNSAEGAQKGGGRSLMQVSAPGIVSPVQEGRVDILITNTGSTIPKEKMQDIFKPFSGSKNSYHFGLGLTIAAMLAHQMNVTIGVSSQENAVTFWISLPMA
jgi:C4-dicarboxylate-specific signal transduction histidine kinase